LSVGRAQTALCYGRGRFTARRWTLAARCGIGQRTADKISFNTGIHNRIRVTGGNKTASVSEEKA
jgi:hypothetical protein